MIKPRVTKQAHIIHTMRHQKLWTRNMEGFRYVGVGGTRSARRKSIKAGLEAANQIHIQSLASYFGERNVYGHLNNPLRHWKYCAILIQNRICPQIPWSCRKLNRGFPARKTRALAVCHTTPCEPTPSGKEQ